MSDRYHPRPLNYTVQAADMYLSGNQLNPNLYAKSVDLVEYFLRGSQDYIRSLDSESSHTVYVGFSGVALTHFMIHLKTERPGSLETAKQLTNMALRKLNGRRVSFLQGDAGPLAIAAAINFTENNTRQAMEFVSRLVRLGEKARNQEFEVLNGWSGYLYALQYVNTFVPGAISGSVLRKYVEIILNEGFNNSQKMRSQVPLVYSWADTNYYGAAHGVAGILYMLLCSGVISASELNSFIKPTLDKLVLRRYPDGNYGSSETSKSDKLVQWCHGAPGFVDLLILANECSGVVSATEVDSLIKPTLNDMIRRRFPSGNYRSSDDDRHDELVQWCHGAPGFIDLLILAEEMLGNWIGTYIKFLLIGVGVGVSFITKVFFGKLTLETNIGWCGVSSKALNLQILRKNTLVAIGGRQYLQLANDATDVVWERGLLQKGYSICHGVCGNAYSFLAMFRRTKNREQLYRAASYFQWTLTYPANEGYKPDRPYSLFEGQAGVLYFLTEMANPETAAFPCYHLF